MISMGNHVKFARFVLLADLYIFTRLEITSSTYCRDYFFRSLYNKTIIRCGFCDIGKGYQLQPSTSTSANNPYLDLDYSGYHKKTLIRQLSMIGSLGNVLNDKNF